MGRKKNTNRTSKIKHQRTDRCINPFKNSKPHIGRNLRKVSKYFLQLNPDIDSNAKICGKCRKCSMYNKAGYSINRTNSQSTLPDFDEGILMDVEESLSECNDAVEKSDRELELEEIFEIIKEKFHSLKNTDPMRKQLLTLGPKSWGVNKLSREFNSSRHQAREALKLKGEFGIWPQISIKPRTSLPDATVKAVVDFYENDWNSRILPSVKDCITVRENGNRTKMQKRLLLIDLRELHTLYKNSHPKNQVSFSVFCKLRPKHVILPGTSGTHVVCVCTIHQNVKLMLDAISDQISKYDRVNPKKKYQYFISEMVCDNPVRDCYFDECENCPGVEGIRAYLDEILDEDSVLEINYAQWTATDRATLLNITSPTEEFNDSLVLKLADLKTHSFIAKKQAEFIESKKNDLLETEVMVMFDFSQNYGYVAQDASQAFHFNNDQCTVFPVILYFKDQGSIQNRSYVFLSDSNKHDTAAVYTVQKLLIPEIKKLVKKVKKLFYFTDGAKQHLKNKYQVANIKNHENDFQLTAEWHYTATAHGKSAFDGIGASFKREAYRSSLLAKPTDALLNFEKLFKWAKSHFKNIEVLGFSKVDHDRSRRKLNSRFDSAPNIDGIMKCHAIKYENHKWVMKKFSFDDNIIEI